MKLNKKIKILTSILLLNSFILNTFPTFAGTLSEDGRYETFVDDNIAIHDILEEDKVDVEIEGDTLVNLVKTQIGTRSVLAHPLNKGEVYTFIYEFDSNVDCEGFLEEATTWAYIVPLQKIVQGKNRIDIAVTIPNSYTGDYDVLLSNRLNGSWSSDVRFTNIKSMILKGDYSDKNLNYFEGIKSVGELEDNKLKIKIKNKNLFDVNSPITIGESYGLPFVMPNTTTFSVNNDSINYNTSRDAWNLGVGGLYKVEKDSVYTVQYDNATSDIEYGISIHIAGLYKSELNTKYWIESEYQKYVDRVKSSVKDINQSNSLSYNTEDYDYLVVYIGGKWKSSPNQIRNITLENISMHKGNNKSYERYNCMEKEISLSEPLRALPNGAKDRIIKKGGQWVVERNLHKMLLDEKFNWYRRAETNDLISVEAYVSDDMIPITDIIPLTNSIKGQTYNSLFNYYTEGIGVKAYNNKCLIMINIKKDMLNTGDIVGFKEWIKENPIEIIYQLSNPIYEPLNIDLNIPLYLNTTYITTNSTIPAILKTTVDRTINRAVEAIELAKTTPTVENIKQARYWTNLMKETIKKDDLQSQLDEITATDIKLDKKQVSANLDLYIRSENNIAISLDTNQIVFDNYTGTSDLEMLKAVDVTINSSLPYDLNAYLPEGIVNGDKTQSIPVNTLNIKDSTDSTYKQFTNTTDKVVLKSGCEAGTNKIHSIDFKLASNNTHKADVYKTTVKFEVEQK